MGDDVSGLRMIWALEREPLSDAEGVRELWGGALQACGDEALDYDLNQRGQWRGFDADRLIVDTLTQRTQLVMVRLGRGGVLALSTGKHGERPRLVAELKKAAGEAAGRVEALVEVSRELMRAQLVFARVDRSDGGQPGAMTCTFIATSGDTPQRLTSLHAAIPTLQLTSTPAGWQARVSAEALDEPTRSDWQSFCDAITADVLT
ncbi:hypothetical protein FRC98_00490 [Lujinxingia vulgaris]|uniref:Uncharacterized protein n=1 Tax=Lujinxingia vulgaris TaxID=2600176 RepID=A0A5C6XGC5_9DELT|nr:hypothetical protein [Lujinxingia vulgaris]TXD38914.1 hypothetical protein FRC98_00490 [Lujinxingia vulgaris]